MNHDDLKARLRTAPAMDGTTLGNEAADALEALEAEVARLERLNVTNIMLDVVPGFDGEGYEVYAKSVTDVEKKLGDMGSELEDWRLGIKRYPQLQEIIDQRDVALARLAELAHYK